MASVGVVLICARKCTCLCTRRQYPVHNLAQKCSSLRPVKYGEVIRNARKAAGLTQTELAELLGWAQGETPHTEVSRLESGKKPLTPETYEAVLAALPELRRVELVEGMGYALKLPPREWGLPDELARLCAAMDHRAIADVLRSARGAYGQSEDRRKKALRRTASPPAHGRSRERNRVAPP